MTHVNEDKIAIKIATAKIAEKSGDKDKYMEFFQEKLKKYNVKSPTELSDDEKKKFFEEIDSEWKSDKEKVGKVIGRRGR